MNKQLDRCFKNTDLTVSEVSLLSLQASKSMFPLILANLGTACKRLFCEKRLPPKPAKWPAHAQRALLEQAHSRIQDYVGMKPWTNALWTFSQFPAYFAPTWPKDQEELPSSTGRQSEWVFRDSWSWLLTMHLQRWRISILRIILVGFSSAKFSTMFSGCRASPIS